MTTVGDVAVQRRHESSSFYVPFSVSVRLLSNTATHQQRFSTNNNFNNNNNTNTNDNVYGAVIMTQSLREFTRFI